MNKKLFVLSIFLITICSTIKTGRYISFKVQNRTNKPIFVLFYTPLLGNRNKSNPKRISVNGEATFKAETTKESNKSQKKITLKWTFAKSKFTYANWYETPPEEVKNGSIITIEGNEVDENDILKYGRYQLDGSQRTANFIKCVKYTRVAKAKTFELLQDYIKKIKSRLGKNMPNIEPAQVDAINRLFSDLTDGKRFPKEKLGILEAVTKDLANGKTIDQITGQLTFVTPVPGAPATPGTPGYIQKKSIGPVKPIYKKDAPGLKEWYRKRAKELQSTKTAPTA